jgi:hypothetical protein
VYDGGLRGSVLLLVWWCGVAAAGPCAPLAEEARRADRWNLSWRLILTSAAVGQAALAITPPLDQSTRRAAAVGAAESLVGATGMWVTPLRIDATGCDLERAEARERGTFWTLHAGNLLVNAGGAVALGELTDWSRAAVGFASGYAVGLVQIYTMPRLRDRHWHAVAAPVAHGWTLDLVGTF